MSDAASPQPSALDEWPAYGLLLLGWIALWTASRQWGFMVPLALVMLAHPWIGGRVQLKVGLIGHAALLGLVAPLYLTFPISGVADGRFSYSFYISYLALIYGTIKLYSPRDRVLYPRLLLYVALVCGFVSVGLPPYVGKDPRWTATSIFGPWTPSPERFYVGLILTYGLLAVVALRRGLRTRRQDPMRPSPANLAGLALSALLVAAGTVAGVWAEKTYYQEIANIYSNLLAGGPQMGGGGGFSDQADLGSVAHQQQSGGRDVALRVFAERVPGYLRGKAFLAYTGRGWTVNWDPGEPTPHSGRFPFAGRRPPTPAENPALVVHPTSDYLTQFFLPLDACGVESVAPTLQLHTPGLTLRGKGASSGYGVFLDQKPLHQEGARDAYVEVPEDEALLASLDATLKRVGITEGMDAADAVARLGGHFQMQFTYRLGVRFKPGRDPIAQFLSADDPAGHCEFFATAGALLLRRAGIPARYVTGFVCEERNPVGQDLWIARNRYAHAWVEYYHPTRGWQTAEFTPPGGVPQPVTASGFSALGEWISGAWTRLVARIVELPGLLLGLVQGLLAWLAAAWWRIGLLVGLALIAIARRLWHGREPVEETAPRTFSPELTALRDRYASLEQRLSHAGLGRHDWETLLEYATRLEGEALPLELAAEEPVAFLRAFALQRYGAAPIPSV